MDRRGRAIWRRAVVTIGVAALTAGALAGPASASTSSMPGSRPGTSGAEAGLRGDVVARGSGAPVPGATVTLAGDGLSVRSGADGSFAFPAPIATEAPYRRVSVVVTAPGWGRWQIAGTPLSPGDTLILHAQLSRSSFTDHVLTPAERAARGIGSVGAPQQLGSPLANTCTGWDYQLVPPEKIWVLRTKTNVSEQYDFVFYATHVLPNEWISSWDADALGAGAIAVRTYAAWRAMSGHAYSSGANCADVRDTIDGYFDPSWTTASAEQAVYATWGSIVYQNGGLFVAHYFAGSKTCAYVTGQYAGWMSQWGTQTCALAHDLWPAIVDTFYSSVSTPTTWRYTKDLLLNPTIGSDPLYAFTGIDATFTRMHGTGSNDAWYLHVAPTQGKVATVYQHRPFLGGTTTPYHDEVWLRCPGTTTCSVMLRVLVFAQGAKNGVPRETTVSVPHDGAWHRYTFDPSPAGIVHAYVRTSVVASVAFDLDQWMLSAPYGGA